MLALILLSVVSDHDARAAAVVIPELAAEATVPAAAAKLERTVVERAFRKRITSRGREIHGFIAEPLAWAVALAGRAEVHIDARVLADKPVGDLSTHGVIVRA